MGEGSELAREVSMDSEPAGVSEVMKGGGRSSEQFGGGCGGRDGCRPHPHPHGPLHLLGLEAH